MVQPEVKVNPAGHHCGGELLWPWFLLSLVGLWSCLLQDVDAYWWSGKAGFGESQGCLEGASGLRELCLSLGIYQLVSDLRRVRWLKGWVAAGDVGF